MYIYIYIYLITIYIGLESPTASNTESGFRGRDPSFAEVDGKFDEHMNYHSIRYYRYKII